MIKNKMRYLILILTGFILNSPLTSQETEITFLSGDLTLEGTLSLPENVEAPHPVLILVHGSGPNDRDQTFPLIGGNSLCLYPKLFNQTIKKFEDIADYLKENGIAVLRYDKRTFTHRVTLNEKDILVDDFILDIEAAIDFAANHPRIDKDKIFLAGYSQGSSLIPIAAINSQKVKGLISLSGPTTPIDSVLAEQIRFLYEECANSPVTGAQIANQFYEQFNQIRNGTFPLDQQIQILLPGNPVPIPQGYGSFWSNWIEIGDQVIANYENANLKNLIIQGADDFNVAPEDALAFQDLKNTEINIYAGINHFLTSDSMNTVSEQILIDIRDWINGSFISSTEEINHSDHTKYLRHADKLVLIFEKELRDRAVVVYDVLGREIIKKEASLKQIEIPLTTPVSPLIVTISYKGNRQSKIIR